MQRILFPPPALKLALASSIGAACQCSRDREGGENSKQFYAMEEFPLPRSRANAVTPVEENAMLCTGITVGRREGIGGPRISLKIHSAEEIDGRSSVAPWLCPIRLAIHRLRVRTRRQRAWIPKVWRLEIPKKMLEMTKSMGSGWGISGTFRALIVVRRARPLSGREYRGEWIGLGHGRRRCGRGRGTGMVARLAGVEACQSAVAQD